MNSRKSLIIVLFFVVLVIGGSATLYALAYPYINPQGIAQRETNENIEFNVKDINSFSQTDLLKATIKDQGLQNSEYYRTHVDASSNTDLFLFTIAEYIQQHGLVGLSAAQKSTFKTDYVKKVREKLAKDGLSQSQINQAMPQIQLPFK